MKDVANVEGEEAAEGDGAPDSTRLTLKPVLPVGNRAPVWSAVFFAMTGGFPTFCRSNKLSPQNHNYTPEERGNAKAMSTMQTLSQSDLRAEAKRYLPGGVGATGRHNPCLGYALYLRNAEGCRIYDVDGKEYIDFNLAHGAAFLGYNHPATRQAMTTALEAGILAGYETEAHTDLARSITEIIPCAERVRYVNTGSEGTMVCVRLARARTCKHKILKFWGHFHGLYDYMMYNSHTPLTPVAPGSYVEPCAESAGMPPQMDDLVIVVPWKDEAALERAMREHGHEIGGIIMEPINYNQGCIVANTQYMQFVRDQATANDIVLIYDEVLSAFRTGPDCAQGYYGVTPDVCVLGKAVAAGAPLTIIAGKAEVMDQVGPLGEVAQSGTFTAGGHDIACRRQRTHQSRFLRSHLRSRRTALRWSGWSVRARQCAGASAGIGRALWYLLRLHRCRRALRRHLEPGPGNDGKFHPRLRRQGGVLPRLRLACRRSSRRLLPAHPRRYR